MQPSAFTYKGKPYSFQQVALNYHKVRNQLPGVLGAIAVNYFKDSFRRQGWRDMALTPWPKRKPGTKRDKGRAILISSGRLRNSIRILQADLRKVVIGTAVPYAQAHNDGVNQLVQVRTHTRGMYQKVKEQYVTRKGTTRSRTNRKQAGEYQVNAHYRKMNLPQRQFMGHSEIMSRKFDAAVIRAVDKVFEI